MATMSAMPRCLQATSLAGAVTTVVSEGVSLSQSTSLRCAWKAGGALKASRTNLSAAVPSGIRRAAAPRSSLGPSGGGGALTPELKDSVDKYLSEHKVVLFMKGNKMFPQCGFSNTCVQILNALQVPYDTVNILEDESLRQGMKEYSAWPTFPQLYIDGEFFGGCDITHESYLNGQLKELLEKAMLS